MSINDPLGDLLTRIRNAQMRNKSKVSSPNSRLRESVLEVLKTEGYIRGYAVVEKDGRSEIEVELIASDSDVPLGVGEATAGPTAAAIGNAVAHALGTRIRDLPLTRERIMSALLKG